MKIFKYSMESVLSYRKNIEEEKKQEFSAVQKKYLDERKVLIDLNDKLANINTNLINSPPRETIELKNLEQYKELLRGRIERQEQLLTEIEEDLEEKEAKCLKPRRIERWWKSIERRPFINIFTMLIGRSKKLSMNSPYLLTLESSNG